MSDDGRDDGVESGGSRRVRGYSFCIRRLIPVSLIGLCALLCGCGDRLHGSCRGKTVIVISIDNVRRDRLGCYGGEVETPIVDELARQGVLFANAITTAPMTLPAHVSLLTGTCPFEHGLRDNGSSVLPPGIPTLAEHLRAKRYATAAFVGSRALPGRTGLRRGFDRYDDRIGEMDFSPDVRIDERSAMDVHIRVAAWMERAPRDRPWFLFVHYNDAHAPYTPRAAFDTQYPGNPYDAEIAATCDALGVLRALLRQAGRWEDSVIVLVSGHGESLGEHGEETHGLLVYESTLAVPAILRLPVSVREELEGIVHEPPISLVDITPTLLDLLGVRTASQPGSGRSLARSLGTNEESERFLLAESMRGAAFGWAPLFCVRQGSRTYIHSPRPEFYDLNEDPGQLTNRISDPQSESFVSSAKELLSSLPLNSGGSNRPDAKEHLETYRLAEKGIGYAQQGEARLAESALREAAALEPGGPAIWTYLGILAMRDERYEEALEAFGRAEGAGDGGTAYNRASVLMKLERFSEAAPLLEAAVAENPSETGAHFHLASIARRNRDYDAALWHYKEILYYEPNRPGVLVEMGAAVLGAGDWAKAVAYFHGELDADPTSAPAWYGLGQCAENAEDYAGAQDHYAQALELVPDDHRTTVALARVYHRLGSSDEAVSLLENALAKGPSNEARDALELQRGDVLRELDRAAEAESMYRSILDRSSRNTDARLRLSHLLIQRGDPEAAVALLEPVVDEQSTHTGLLSMMSVALQTAGHRDRAKAFYLRVLELRAASEDGVNIAEH